MLRGLFVWFGRAGDWDNAGRGRWSAVRVLVLDVVVAGDGDRLSLSPGGESMRKRTRAKEGHFWSSRIWKTGRKDGRVTSSNTSGLRMKLWRKAEQSTRQGSRHGLSSVWAGGRAVGSGHCTAGKSGTVISGRQGRDQETTQTSLPGYLGSARLSLLGSSWVPLFRCN